MRNCSFLPTLSLGRFFLALELFASLNSLSKIIWLRNVIKHLTQCFITKSNTPLRVVFSTLFSVLHLVMNHYVSYLIYYVRIAITNLSAIGLRDLNSIARRQGEVAYVVGNFLFQVIFVCFFSSLLIHVNEAETNKKNN